MAEATAAEPRPQNEASLATAPLAYKPATGGFSTFRSLRYRDYRLLWIANLFGSGGMWIQQVTLGWVTYDLTGSAFLLGAINGMRSLPLLILGPIAGVVADRADRKRLMMTTQLLIVVSAALMATIILTGALQVWQLFVFTFLTGIAWAFNQPVRQSVIANVIPPNDMMNAMALNSAGFNIVRIAGPTIAGIFVAKIGAGENFYLQAIMYAGVAICLARVNVPDVKRASTVSLRANLAEGISYVWNNDVLRIQIILGLVPMVVGMPYMQLMPIFAKDILGQGPGGLGMLFGAAGVGAVAGTLALATMGDVKNKGLIIVGLVFLMGIGLVAFALSRNFALSLGLLMLLGAVQMGYMTMNQTLIQLTVTDEMRGRVNGIYMLDMGLVPLGSLIAGATADIIGTPTTVALMGGACSLLAILFAIRSRALRFS